MAGVEPRQTSVGKQDAVAQACLLAEDDGHVTDTDDLVDLGMGHIPFAQSRVGTRIARNVEVGILERVTGASVPRNRRRARSVPGWKRETLFISSGKVTFPVAATNARARALTARYIDRTRRGPDVTSDQGVM